MRSLGTTFGMFVLSIVSAVQVHQPGTLKADETWSQFRGPNGSGISSVAASLPSELDLEKNVKWKISLPSGHSSPVLFDGHIYLTASQEDSLLTICLDQSTGRELWRQAVNRERKETLDPRNNPASPSPVVNATGVYVFFPEVGLLGYTTKGELKWKTPQGPFNNIYGMGASPIICDGRLILVCDHNLNSYIAAFDLESGKQLWKTDRPEATSGHCTPIEFRPEGGEVQIIAVGSFYLTAYSASTGKKIWWVGGLCFEMKSTPVIQGDTIFINGYGSPQNEVEASFKIDDFTAVVSQKDSDSDGLLKLEEMPDELSKNFFPAVDLDGSGKLDVREWAYFQNSIASKNSMMAIRLGGTGDMTSKSTLWKYFRNIPQLPSPVVVGETLFMISDQGIVSSLNTASGQLIKRGRLQGAEGNIYASPVVADNKIYFITEDGKVAVTDTTPQFNILSTSQFKERCYATPAFDRDHIYIRTEKALYAFGK